MMVKAFSSDYYDSVRQREIWWKKPTDLNRDWQRAALRARLRFNYLFSPSIALNRSDVLDGACLMHTTPAEVLAWLSLAEGDSPPITIFTRSGRLDDDLLDWVRPMYTGTLHPVLFFVVDPELRATLNEGLKGELPTELTNWMDLPRAIGRVVGVDIGSQLFEFWNAWITQAPRYLRIEQYWQQVDYASYVPSLLSNPDRVPSHVGAGRSVADEARVIYAEAVSAFRDARWQRAALTRWLELNLPRTDPEVAEVVQQVINLGIARARSAATNTEHELVSTLQLGEGWIQRNASRLLTGDRLSAESPGLTDLALPAHIGLWLVDCDYASLMRSVRQERMAWLLSGQLDDLRRLAEHVADAMISDPAPLRATPSPVLVRNLRVASIAGGAMTAVASVLTGAPWVQTLGASGSAAYGALMSDFGLGPIVERAQRARYRNQLLHFVKPEV